MQQDGNGKKWISVDALQNGPFQVGKNGKHYLNLNVWINDQVDQYGNHASVSLSQSKEERESKAKRIYIGNLKRNTPNGTAQSPGVAQGYPAQPQYGAPQQPYAPGGVMPPPQGNPYAPAAAPAQQPAPPAWNPAGPPPF